MAVLPEQAGSAIRKFLARMGQRLQEQHHQSSSTHHDGINGSHTTAFELLEIDTSAFAAAERIDQVVGNGCTDIHPCSTSLDTQVSNRRRARRPQ